jgi:glycosyltransferase involved in cell wall biosynthesis
MGTRQDGAPLDHGQLIPLTKAPRLLIVGPMLGRHPGHVPFVGEVLGAHLTRIGYSVVLTSQYRHRLLRLVDIVATLIRRARRTDVQILQVYGGLSFIGEDIASSLGVLFGQKVIMHVHGGAMPAFVTRHPRWSRRVLSRAAGIVAPSPFLEKELRSRGFAVRVIPNAVDLPTYPYNHRQKLAPRLVWMRTFHDVYNPEMAVRVLARIKKLEPQATLVMAGQEKGTMPAVKRLAQQLNVSEAIRFPGFLNAGAKVRELSAGDIFLNTNRVDNTPVSVIEACAMGLPVVATDVGGIAALLTHEATALLVPDDDDEAMAAAVMRLLRQPDLAGRLSRAGRQMAEHLSWENTTPQWQELIGELMPQPVVGHLVREVN